MARRVEETYQVGDRLGFPDGPRTIREIVLIHVSGPYYEVEMRFYETPIKWVTPLKLADVSGSMSPGKN